MADCKEKLFDQFPPVSTEEWMEKVTADLKDADFNKKLVWRTNEGFNVKPMYRAEDIYPENILMFAVLNAIMNGWYVKTYMSKT